MNPIRALLSLIIVVAILFASTMYVHSIGFEAEKAYESVFVIYSGSSLGSGFAVGENCVVTNAHVIDNPKKIVVETYGGDKYNATVLGMDEYQDIAVLIVNKAKFPFLEIADLSAMKTGEDIFAIGAPKGMAYTLTKGGISAKERMIGNQSYIQIDAAINEGNSGGPLLNNEGMVLGMNTMKMSDSEGLGLAIPITRVCKYLNSLGIELNTKGNVEDAVELPEDGNSLDIQTSENAEGNESEAQNTENEKSVPIIAYIAVVVAVLSLGANAILTILLMSEKKKSVVAPYDPRERTDFDIDFLE